MIKIACIPDCHSPYEDKQALDLAIKVIKSFRPDVLVHMGDLCDLYSVSRFDKDPIKNMGLEYELAAAGKVLDRLDNLAPRKIFLEGNHEKRLNKYLYRQAPELHSVLNVQRSLKLDERKWEFYPYQEPAVVGDVSFVHDLGFAGKTSLRQTIDAHPSNIIMAHTHRFESLTRGNLRREVMTIHNFGWLGDPREIDYLPSVKVKQDWTHGFGLIYQDKDRSYTSTASRLAKVSAW